MAHILSVISISSSTGRTGQYKFSSLFLDIYSLTAALGISQRRPTLNTFEKDKTPRPRRVDYNGYNFLITTYEDALLREIQLHSLESELEQAIGRARLLRYDCTVWLFCGFPCEQAELHMENYLPWNDDS